MSTDKRITVEDVFGDCGFRIVWAAQDHWADVKVYEVADSTEEGVPLFLRDERKTSTRHTPDITDAEVYLEGFIKWDGCCEFRHDQIHWCGPYHIQKHCDLLRYLYDRAASLMGREELDEVWDDNTYHEPANPVIISQP